MLFMFIAKYYKKISPSRLFLEAPLIGLNICY